MRFWRKYPSDAQQNENGEKKVPCCDRRRASVFLLFVETQTVEEAPSPTTQ
jgi:hypothetical protein